jgi:hypothetical protein
MRKKGPTSFRREENSLDRRQTSASCTSVALRKAGKVESPGKESLIEPSTTTRDLHLGKVNREHPKSMWIIRFWFSPQQWLSTLMPISADTQMKSFLGTVT